MDTIHKIAAAFEQAGGISNTDKYGNIITDDENIEDKSVTEQEPIGAVNHNQEDEEGQMAIDEGKKEYNSH